MSHVEVIRGGGDHAHEHTRVTADALVKTGPGVLVRIVIGEVTASGFITFYDKTTEAAPEIYSMHLHKDFHQLHASSIEFNVKFVTGLYVGFDAAVAADLTVVYE